NFGIYAATTAHCMRGFELPNGSKLHLSTVTLDVQDQPNNESKDLKVFKVGSENGANFHSIYTEDKELEHVDLVYYGEDRKVIRRRITEGFKLSKEGMACNHDFLTAPGHSGGGLYGGCTDNETATGCKLI